VLRRLSVRIALLIIVLGPTLFIGAIIVTTFYIQAGHPRYPLIFIELPLLALLIPLILGILAARLVSEPLRNLAAVLASLRQSNYQTKLAPSDVQEFDRVIAEVNELSARLEHEETLRRDLISDTAHELGTPVAALYGQLKGVKDGVLQLDPDRVQTLYEQAERLTELIERLGEYSSIRAAAIRPQLEPVDVARLVRRLQRHFAADLRTASLTLSLDLAAATPLQADPKLLERLLANLITNAIRYSGGSRLTLRYDGRTLAVADNGRGLPASALPYLFERFYRVDQSRSRATGGLGLGLAIAREIAEAHHWALTVANAHPGAVFMISIKNY
jgi:signal transduction histidine kinase